MTLAISARAGRAASAATPMLACLLPAVTGFPAHLRELDTALGGALRRLFDRRDFRGGRDEVLHLAGGRRGPRRILLVGTGTPTDDTAALRRAATLAARQAHRMGARSLTLLASGLDARDIEQILVGAQIGAWEYTDMKTPPPERERREPLTSVTLLVDNASAAKAAVDAAAAIGAGYAAARRLSMMPANVCTPELLTDTARDLAKRHRLKVTVLGRAEMERLGMGSFLAVAQGTPQDPRLVAIEYRKGAPDDAPIVLVG
jgi:leucyl aminopeptidase